MIQITAMLHARRIPWGMMAYNTVDLATLTGCAYRLATDAIGVRSPKAIDKRPSIVRTCVYTVSLSMDCQMRQRLGSPVVITL